MAYRCILDGRKECNGCGECQETEEDEEIKRDIREEKEYQMLIEKGLI